MKLRRFIVLCTLSLLSSRAAAFSGAGAATSDYQNPDNTKGLCTSDNQDEPYYQEGLCKSMTEQMNHGCTKEKVDNICKIMAGKKKKPDGSIDTSISPPPYDYMCQNKDKTKGWADLVKDPAQCSFFMMNYIAMTVARESNWDVLKDEDAGGKGPGGLAHLNIGGDKNTDMKNPDYACGCRDDVATDSEQSNVTFSGQMPGPLDGHHTVICAETMALTKIEKDKGFGGGNSHDRTTQVDEHGKKKDPRSGMAILFASHQGRATDDTRSEDQSPEAKNKKWYGKKVAALCKYMFSNTNPWRRELTDDVTLPSGTGTATQ